MHAFFRADSGGRCAGGSGGGLLQWKYAIDPGLRTDFGTVPAPDGPRRPLDLTYPEDALAWEDRREEFVRFRTVRADASYSLGPAAVFPRCSRT